MDSDDKFLLYEDELPKKQYLLLWMFDAQILIDTYGDSYGNPVMRATLAGMKKIKESGNKKIRDREFKMWLGDYYHYFCLGIPGEIRSEIIKIFTNEIEQIKGYQIMDFGNWLDIPLVAKFQYNHGKISIYMSLDNMGEHYIDDDDILGSGLEIELRYAYNSFL